MCAHETVERHESANPRLPYVDWTCGACGSRFQPVRVGRIAAWQARRRLRRQLARWRNG